MGENQTLAALAAFCDVSSTDAEAVAAADERGVDAPTALSEAFEMAEDPNEEADDEPDDKESEASATLGAP